MARDKSRIIVSCRDNQLSRQETEGHVTPMPPRYRMERPNNTDGRNSPWTSQLSRLETTSENRSISAVYEQSAEASGYLLEIRKLAAARRPELYANQICEYVNVAIAMHAQIQELTTTIANDMKRKRKDLETARKRLRTQETLTDWNECEVYRLRRQLDAILDIKGRPRMEYERATDALQEEMDWSDAGSSTSAPPIDKGGEVVGGTVPE